MRRNQRGSFCVLKCWGREHVRSVLFVVVIPAEYPLIEFCAVSAFPVPFVALKPIVSALANPDPHGPVSVMGKVNPRGHAAISVREVCRL
jgi:hypothetical protein